MDQEKIGKYIFNKRKEKNMTQQDLASKLGVTDKAISKWERGIGLPDISYLENLSDILGISILELLRGEDMNKNMDNKDIIESFKYGSILTKNKIKLIINTLLITIILFISFLVLFLNIKNIIYLNKEYDNYVSENIYDLDSYYNVILNNQGKYSDLEYEEIKNYVNNGKNIYNDKTKKYLLKEKVKVKDYEEFSNDYSIDLIENSLSGTKIYNILLKYDLSKIDNMINYVKYNDYFIETVHNIFNKLDKKLDYNISYNEINLGRIMDNEYRKEELLLKDIIEVGELNV